MPEAASATCKPTDVSASPTLRDMQSFLERMQEEQCALASGVEDRDATSAGVRDGHDFRKLADGANAQQKIPAAVLDKTIDTDKNVCNTKSGTAASPENKKGVIQFISPLKGGGLSRIGATVEDQQEQKKSNPATSRSTSEHFAAEAGEDDRARLYLHTDPLDATTGTGHEHDEDLDQQRQQPFASSAPEEHHQVKNPAMLQTQTPTYTSAEKGSMLQKLKPSDLGLSDSKESDAFPSPPPPPMFSPAELYGMSGASGSNFQVGTDGGSSSFSSAYNSCTAALNYISSKNSSIALTAADAVGANLFMKELKLPPGQEMIFAEHGEQDACPFPLSSDEHQSCRAKQETVVEPEPDQSVGAPTSSISQNPTSIKKKTAIELEFEVHDLQAELRQAETYNFEYKKRNDALHTELEALKKEKRLLLEHSLTALGKDQEIFHRENRHLHERLLEAQDCKLHLQKEVQESQKVATILQQDNERVNAENSFLLEKTSCLEERLNGAVTELGKANLEKERLQNQFDALEEKQKTCLSFEDEKNIRQEQAELKEQNRNLKDFALELQRRFDELELLCARQSKACESLKEETATLVQEKQDLAQQLQIWKTSSEFYKKKCGGEIKKSFIWRGGGRCGALAR
ncbi:unnamed protein product [Amoebophrya sp. A120]|nr:unnamed protein product [Amoebophrya sp. A120]|eukprot:GSA120T00010470001.1